MSKVEEAIIERYGERCPDFDADCDTCQAWAEFDKLRAARAAAFREARECVPSNWVDPRLTGPNGIGSPPYNCRQVENLLRQIADAILSRAQEGEA